MTADASRARRGVTLTEILISIMILAVGMVSLATLFPIGLLRIRDATRNSRSALLSRNAGAELQARNLFDRKLFRSTPAWAATTTIPPPRRPTSIPGYRTASEAGRPSTTSTPPRLVPAFPSPTTHSGGP